MNNNLAIHLHSTLNEFVFLNQKLTVLFMTQNGRENTEFESDAYKVVSFSAPRRIASSKRIAGINKNIYIYLLQNES